MWALLRNIVVSAFAIWTLKKYGPPVKDLYFLPTIEGVANTFHAVQAQPHPLTTFTNMPTPRPAPLVSKTVFIVQTGFQTQSVPEAATITGGYPHNYMFIHHHDPSNGFSSSRQRFSHMISQVIQAVLLEIRQLLDNFYFQVGLFAAPVGIWPILVFRNRITVKGIISSHASEIVKVQDEAAESKALAEAQLRRLEEQKILLRQAREEIKAKVAAQERSSTEIDLLKSRLRQKDKTISEHDDELANANRRADTAESSNKSLEQKAKKSQSDHDSALTKSQNEVKAQKRGFEEAQTAAETAGKKLRDARTEASTTKKKVTELDRRVVELGAQVKAQDASIAEKDAMIRTLRDEKKTQAKDAENMSKEYARASKERREAKAKDENEMRDLRSQLTGANKLRRAAEAEASAKQAETANWVEQRNAAKARVSELEAFASERTAALVAQEDRNEVLLGQIADLLEQLNVRGEESHHLVQEEGTGNEDAGQSVQEDAEDAAPLDTGKRLSRHDKKKLRSNKRADGSIRTTNHPRHAPPKQQGVAEQVADEESAALGGQRHSKGQDEVPKPHSKPPKRICPYFQTGNCLYGDRCRDAHAMPGEPGDPKAVPETPQIQAPSPAPTQPANGHQSARPFDPKPGKPVCKFFQQGYCKYAGKCRDQHDLTRAMANPRKPS